MIEADDREEGFYWISIDGQEAEVALWQMEWQQWLVTGHGQPLPDSITSTVVVLSEELPSPALPAYA